MQVEAKGYGNYNITVNQTSSFTGSLTDVSGEITRGELRYYDNNIFKKPKLKIIPLGGLLEIGKNITVFEYENDIIINAVTGEFYAVTNRYE